MATTIAISKNDRKEIRLNQTNKQACGAIDSLCEEYEKLESQVKFLADELETVKSKLKARLNENADYYTANYRIVISITPEKTEFKYDTKKIIEQYPEIKENKKFGKFSTKKEVQSLKSIKKINM